MITKTGQEFIDHMKMATTLMINGQSAFVSLSMALEDNDWILVYAAAMAMVRDIESNEH